MDTSISPKVTVDQLLAARPQTAMIFLALRTSCVGCQLARFCALEDVARVYELPLQEFMERIETTYSSQRE